MQVGQEDECRGCPRHSRKSEVIAHGACGQIDAARSIPFLPGSPVRVYHCLMTSHTTSVRNQHASFTQ